MAPTKTATPGNLLTRAAGERKTGALVVGGHPGGAVYIFEGRVIYAESSSAPGVGELLTSSGRLAGRTWQSALDMGGSHSRVGRLIVEQGHLTQGELELCVLGATYDAAYFVLGATAAPVEFVAGATHWLGPVVHIDATAVSREVRRRIGLLDDIFPDQRIDTAAVIPVTRAPRERVTLTSLQWELLVHADGQRTPGDLAQLLGRAGYATIQELRRLAALGLIELPDVRAGDGTDLIRLPQPRGASVALDRAPAAVAPPAGRAQAPADRTPAPRERPRVPLDRAPMDETDVPLVPVINGAGHTARMSPANSDPPPASGGGDSATGMNRLPRLARRKPGAKLPKEMAAAENPPVHQGTDEVLLKRIRTALRALR
ncbi:MULTISPECIES: DUF4388 domain-containing protein [Actinoplanes]|uniref:DUF4388 domain-containing protein n=1 Tax=Actinoplanes TaxID=1865 RepID=UPI0005F2F779|nr:MULTISPECIES: DUF4388 domain-containing protein [Actinoplanes]GLY01554.1 hypothetical protein Acsp01_19330 [Actinoplanes sp. NBRC 101535]